MIAWPWNKSQGSVATGIRFLDPQQLLVPAGATLWVESHWPTWLGANTHLHDASTCVCKNRSYRLRKPNSLLVHDNASQWRKISVLSWESFRASIGKFPSICWLPIIIVSASSSSFWQPTLHPQTHPSKFPSETYFHLLPLDALV